MSARMQALHLSEFSGHGLEMEGHSVVTLGERLTIDHVKISQDVDLFKLAEFTQEMVSKWHLIMEFVNDYSDIELMFNNQIGIW